MALLGLVIAYYSRRLRAARRSYRDQVAGLIHDNSKLKAEYASLKDSFCRQGYKIRNLEVAESSAADYYVAYSLHGYCTVVRRCTIDGHTYRTRIKSFSDHDTAFNILLAEELCDKLNEK